MSELSVRDRVVASLIRPDLTPHVLSSVYLYYDPDFKFLSLGKLSALKEIEWIRTVARPVVPELKYYFMGTRVTHMQHVPTTLPQVSTYTAARRCATRYREAQRAAAPLTPDLGAVQAVGADVSGGVHVA